MNALSEVQIYIFGTKDQGDCIKPGIICAGIQNQINERNMGSHMANSVIDVEINHKGDLSSFLYPYGNSSEEFEEKTYFYSATSQTRSGAYLFNPRHQKAEIKFDKVKIYDIEVGKFLHIVQVYKHNTNSRLLKTYMVNKSGCPNLMKQLFMEIQFVSDEYIEVNLNLHKKSKSSSSQYKGYIDDSMFMVERPIYNKNSSIRRTNDYELNGYYTYPCVHGGMLRETYTRDNRNLESFFGWANSNAMA